MSQSKILKRPSTEAFKQKDENSSTGKKVYIIKVSNDKNEKFPCTSNSNTFNLYDVIQSSLRKTDKSHHPSVVYVNNTNVTEDATKQKPTAKKSCVSGWIANRHNLKFHDKWLEEFPFVEYDSEKNLMHCKICRKYVYDWRKSSPFVIGTDNFRHSMLKYHEQSIMHIECQEFADAVSCEDSEHMQNKSDLYKEQLIHVFKSVYFIFKNKMPYTYFPQLCESQKKEGADFEVYTTHIKVVPLFGKFIGMSFEKELSQKIYSLSVFSLVIDASFRRNVESHDLVYIKYLDGFTVQTVFLGVIDSGAKLHDSLYNILTALFKRYNIDKWADRVAYIMTDRSDSHLWLEGLVNIIKSNSLNFVCEVNYLSHKITYCANVVESHKTTATFNALIWSLYCCYEKIDKSKKNLIHINEELAQIVKYYGNLPKNSFTILYFEALSAVEKDYAELISLLESEQQLVHYDFKVRKSGSRIISLMTRSSFICKLAVLVDIYSCLRDFSSKLSSDTLLPYDVFILIDETCSDIQKAANGEGPKGVEITEELSTCHGMFKNVKIKEDSNMHLILPELKKFAQDVIHYLSSLVDGSILEKSYIFNMNLWPEDEELREFGNSEFRDICQKCGASEETADRAVLEWIAFKQKISEIFPAEVKENSRSVFMKMVAGYNSEFPLVADVLSKILLLNFESGEIQRGYHEMCLNKSYSRSMLSIQSVQTMMMISMYGPSLGEFDSTLSVDLFINSGNRRFCKKIIKKKKSTNLVYD